MIQRTELILKAKIQVNFVSIKLSYILMGPTSLLFLSINMSYEARYERERKDMR